MSTSLNDTVAEVCHEFMMKLDERSIKRKLSKYMHTPSLFLKWIHKKLTKQFRRVYGQLIFGRKIHSSDARTMTNTFTPSARTYPDIKIAVYTVITGGYDNLRMPAYVDSDIDYYVVTDSRIESANLRTGGH